MAAGIVPMIMHEEFFNGLFAMGVVFAIVGLVNKDKWKKNRKTLKNLNKSERRLMIIVSFVLALLVGAGLVVFFMAN